MLLNFFKCVLFKRFLSVQKIYSKDKIDDEIHVFRITFILVGFGDIFLELTILRKFKCIFL